MQTRGQADVPWYSSSLDQRSGGRLPELQLPQSYGPIETIPPPSHPPFFTNKTTDIGLKTPSPSPTALASPPQGHPIHQGSTEPSSYTHHLTYSAPSEPYSTMDHQQQQYLASQQSHMSQGQTYAPPSTTALPQYPSYQSQQPPVLQPAPHSYPPTQSPYSQGYTYANGMPSPHGSNQPVSTSMGHSMNTGLPPLPSKLSAPRPITLITANSL